MKKLGIITLAVAVSSLLMASAAQSASDTECLGSKPNVFGTSGSDTIRVVVDEGGASITLNGKSTFMDTWTGPITIWSKAGNDTVTYSSDGGGGAVICTGDGDDTVSGGMISRIHTGGGYDRVNQYLECGYTTEVFKAEIVRSSYDTTNEEGPCN